VSNASALFRIVLNVVTLEELIIIFMIHCLQMQMMVEVARLLAPLDITDNYLTLHACFVPMGVQHVMFLPATAQHVQLR
jgi:hypothetical protein